MGDNKVAKSTKSKPQSSVVKWEWKANNQMWVVLSLHCYNLYIHLLNQLVRAVINCEDRTLSWIQARQYSQGSRRKAWRKSSWLARKWWAIPIFANTCIHAEGDLLDTSIDLTDKDGILAAKMKIAFSRISGSGDNIEEFMKKVDDDVSLMGRLPSNLSTLGQVLKLTKDIMDKISQVIHLSFNISKSADRCD